MPDLTHYTAGLFAGFAQTVVGHPFDTIKVRMQTSNFPTSMSCLRWTLKHEGARGLFAGISSPMVSSIIFSAILFGSYENFKELFSQGEGAQRRLSVSGNVAACVAAGVVETTCYAPFEHIKTQLQTQYGRTEASLWSTLRHMYEHGGIRGAYTGYVAQLLRECPGNVVYFGTYTASRTHLPSSFSDAQRTLAAGGISGICYWSATYPLDVVKSRMQAQPAGLGARPPPQLGQPSYSGFVDCVAQTYRSLGARGFFRGIGPCLLRAFPANAAAFGAYEYVKAAIEGQRLRSFV